MAVTETVTFSWPKALPFPPSLRQSLTRRLSMATSLALWTHWTPLDELDQLGRGRRTRTLAMRRRTSRHLYLIHDPSVDLTGVPSLVTAGSKCSRAPRLPGCVLTVPSHPTPFHARQQPAWPAYLASSRAAFRIWGGSGLTGDRPTEWALGRRALPARQHLRPSNRMA